jgi:hypothetical protein
LDLHFSGDGMEAAAIAALQSVPLREGEENILFGDSIDGPLTLLKVKSTFSCERNRTSKLYVTIFSTYEVGQKVGIAVYSEIVATSNTSLAPLRRIFGDPRRTTVYTGEITHVGETQIEYDINSYQGCSGSIVFLFDKNQPNSVKNNDAGCAIAVHSGSRPRLGRNMGSKLSATPMRS